MNQINFLLLLTVLVFLQCTPAKKAKSTDYSSALATSMTGTFTNEKQVKKDTSFFNIVLQMYPIWQDRKGENWLYIERAFTKTPENPYLQRIYKIEKAGDNIYRNIIYTLSNPKDFIGKWNTPKAFNALSPDQLILKDDCAVYLKKLSKNYYHGSTKIGTCINTLRGANYATSEVEVFKNKIVSWDRGYDDDGKQVWGAVESGYVFNRIE